MKKLILRLCLLCLTGCTAVTWTAPDGSKIVASSFMSNKRLSGSLKTNGPARELVINELNEDQTSGAAAVVEAAVKAAVTAVKP